MKKYDVNYMFDFFTKNDQIRPDGYSSIEFIKKGDKNITISGVITLDDDTPSFVLINRPDEIIRNNFNFVFDGLGTDPKLAVIKTYYTERN